MYVCVYVGWYPVKRKVQYAMLFVRLIVFFPAYYYYSIVWYDVENCKHGHLTVTFIGVQFAKLFLLHT